MRIHLLFTSMLVALSGAAAQAPPSETIKSDVTMIQVPVVVRDHDGHVVANLGKDDFQLFDNGKRVDIASFSVEKPGSQVIPDRSLPAVNGAQAGAAGGAPAIDIPERFIGYFFDDLTIRDPGDLSRIRDAAARQLGALEPGDRVAIFTSSCRVALDFTNDQSKLQQAVARIELRPAAVCRVSPTQILQVELLKGLVRRMTNLPARREIVIISSGFVVDHDRSQEPVTLTDAAIRSKVVINALDLGESTGNGGGIRDNASSAIRGQDQRPNINMADPQVLVELAHGTGGSYFVGNDFGLSFRKLATPESHYVLAFVPTAKADGRFHQLKVKLENERKLKVEARAGYYAPQRSE